MMSYVAAFTGNIITFIAATSQSWTSPVLVKLEDAHKTPFDSPLSSEEASWISALLPFGAIFGPFIYGFLAELIGRKLTLLTCAVPFLFSYLLLAFAKVPWIYYVARFIAGTSLGGVFTVIPIYVGEIAEDSNRAPESPQYYVNKHRYEQAKTTLQKIRRGGDQVVENELSDMQVKVGEERGSFLDMFKQRGSVRAFFMAITLITFQQFSGASLEPELCSIIIGCTQFTASFLSPLIIERLGRKPLLLISLVGVIVSQVPLGAYAYLKEHHRDVSGISFLPIICLVGYIIAYNTGIGPIPWAMLGELFPANIRSIASSTVTAFCWFLSFLITKYFKSISNSIGMSASFLIFAGCCVVAVPYCYYYVIETKAKSLKEIQEILNGQNWKS
ncbi:hypothetical protein NQ315_011917 [Exocentrus adspersus]|uniref:Major facilitator superfamily (MFS) profile domain-containing protein n=1 Tax=Exocentrus adspersus TaxID=1586481 RepID=A0AAV8W2E8_9CUCU|nr:hypothetical protein NQ315_011917 [Exocentrus adspersus]